MKSQFNTIGKSLNMVKIALFTMVLVICSWISIPTIVPFTLQTFGVYLAFCSNSRRIFVFSMIIGLFICYIFGTAWFMTISAKNTGSIGWLTAVSWCVILFVISDLLKLFLALTIEKRVGPAIKKHK